MCLKCSQYCLECINDSKSCTLCFPNHFRKLVSQKCICIDGYIEELAAPICIECSYKCKTCINNKDECNTCEQTHFRHLIGNTCLCIDGYYDSGAKVCSKCHHSCFSCKGGTD